MGIIKHYNISNFFIGVMKEINGLTHYLLGRICFILPNGSDSGERSGGRGACVQWAEFIHGFAVRLTSGQGKNHLRWAKRL